MNILYRDIRFLKLNVNDKKEKIIFFQDHIFDNIYYTTQGHYAFRYSSMPIEQNITEYDASLYLSNSCSINDVKQLFNNRPGIFRIPVVDANDNLIGEYYDASSEGKSLYQRIEDRCYDLLEHDYFRKMLATWAREHHVSCIGREDRTNLIRMIIPHCSDINANVIIDTEICDNYRKILNMDNRRVSLSYIIVQLLKRKVISFLRESGVQFFVAYGIKKSELSKLTPTEKAFLNRSLEEAVNDDEHVRHITKQDRSSLKFIISHKKDINRISKIVFNGIHNQLLDMVDPYFNIVDGKRVTIGQPLGECQNIHIFGPCLVQGLCVNDAQTIPSLLQAHINQSGYKHIRVYNHGLSYGKDLLNDLLMMMSTEFSEGDIVIWMSGFSDIEKIVFMEMDVPVIDCMNCIVDEHDWFYNIPFHCNSFANIKFAGEIYKSISYSLIDQLTSTSPAMTMIRAQSIGLTYNPECILSSELLKQYIEQLKLFKLHSAQFKRIGCIVMHANPCTLGHLYLIRKALERVDFVYVFLIQHTDKNSFDYIDREHMLKASLKDNSRVCIVPSGHILATPLSFPEYFNRSEATKITPMLDNKVFALHIAPVLDIKYRFLGSEPEDAITNAFVQECQRYLPTQGIEVEVIERTKIDGITISAKSVRYAWKNKQYKELAKYVSFPTYMKLLELNNDNTEYNFNIKQNEYHFT